MRLLVCLLVLVGAGVVRADYMVSDSGEWPKDWPEELEGLRKTARTLEGPMVPLLHYAIPFTSREAFEAAWPHLLKVAEKGAPIVLRRGENFFLSGGTAGVVVHAPPADKNFRRVRVAPEKEPIWSKVYLEVVVDGEIVDLNRIPLPPDTVIVDERFGE